MPAVILSLIKIVIIIFKIIITNLHCTSFGGPVMQMSFVGTNAGAYVHEAASICKCIYRLET